MIFKGSRYEKTGISYVTGPKGQPVPVLRIRFIPSTPAGYLHTFRDGERLDTLAYNFYKNGEKFWLIADANDEMDPEDLMEPGRRLRIPPDRT
jgi:nucleoid-associated protein YgaU